MRAFIVALALLSLASAGPVAAWQPSEVDAYEEVQPTEEPEETSGDRPGRPLRSTRPGGGRVARNRCESSAGDLQTAIEYCKGVLKCESKGMTMECGGTPNNYKCKCV